MSRTTKQTQSYDGFAIPLEGDTYLGLALLTPRTKKGATRRSPTSARLMKRRSLQQDSRRRRERLERGEDPGLCPHAYKLWARGTGGEFRVACEIE
jgi:hypothetical protein